MIAGFRLTIFLASVCSGAAASAQSPEAIVIRFRPPYGICTGVCPNFETEVHAEGFVRALDRRGGGTHDFEATPRDLRRFTELKSVSVALD